ncbi:diguanylate cyclase [Lunatibacter salilacus]|uniref:diguanylate cyclase n=1 Tax=Lunatibacter salilacus TaxID=2483804 RepID=UPI00131E7990|nr:diguanylate cyclase [Lunatibacter salilacus]
MQKNEKRKRAEELIIANQQLDFQKDEKQKRADELLIANKELALQYNQKQKRTEELLNTKRELASQKTKIQKWVKEVLKANKELATQYHQKQQKDEELVIVQNELTLQYEAKKELASELTLAYLDLVKTEDALRVHIDGLEDMITMISHNVRQPITQILGISNLLDVSMEYTPDELKTIVNYLKTSVLDLDHFTKEFTVYMQNIYKKDLDGEVVESRESEDRSRETERPRDGETEGRDGEDRRPEKGEM